MLLVDQDKHNLVLAIAFGNTKEKVFDQVLLES